jgi:hypothetical protein
MIFLTLYLLFVMKFYSSARNFIYCFFYNSLFIENKSTAAAKLDRWLQRIIPLSQHFNFSGCFHISEKNIIHRRTSCTKEEIHLIEIKIPLQQIKQIICYRRLFLCHYILCSRGFVFWVYVCVDLNQISENMSMRLIQLGQCFVLTTISFTAVYFRI